MYPPASHTRLGLALALSVLGLPALRAQTGLAGYFAGWDARVDAAQASQPKWITPMATTTPRLEQEFRYDQTRQTLEGNGGTLDVYDGGKGLEFIPTEATEVSVSLPAYQVRRGAKPASGLADWPGILLKYRLASAPEASGDYAFTVFAQYGLPTGAIPYTTNNHVFTPTVALGKGWGAFDLQATVGDAIPTADHSHAGRAILTNITAQYHLGELFWPELELNRTDWSGGARSGRSQTYLTPGLILGRFVLARRSKLIVGAAYQTALSRVYPLAPSTPTFNHNWILSVRTTF